MLNKLVLDIAQHTEGVDPLPLFNASVQLVVLKVDSMFLRNAKILADTGMPIAAYHWIDPTEDADKQVTRTLNTISNGNLPVLAVFADFEQYWSNWDQWHKAILELLKWNLVARFAPSRLSTHARQVFEGFKTAGREPIGYTRASFVNDFAPQASEWMGNYRWWLAHYGKYDAQKLTWAEFKNRILPTVNFFPSLPPAVTADKVVGHQFTGDKFSLPGLYGDAQRTRFSAVDVNLFDEGFLTEIGAIPNPRPLPDVLNEAIVNTSPSLRVRSGPGTSHPVVYILREGTHVEIVEIRDGWAKLRGFGEEWCKAEFLRILNTETPGPVATAPSSAPPS